MEIVSSDVMRGFNDILIMSVLKKGDSYGYQISKEIEELSEGLYSLKETTLYSALDRYERLGLTVSYDKGEVNGRPRVYFKLTETGKKHLAGKIEEWKSSVELIKRFV